MMIGIAWKCNSWLDRNVNNAKEPIIRVTKHLARNNMKSPILFMEPNLNALPTITCQAWKDKNQLTILIIFR